jgi:hypothetical protein
MIRFDERLKVPTWIAAIALAGVLSSCNLTGTPDTTAPTVVETTPSGLAVAPTNEPVTARFDEEIDAATLTTTSFALTTGLAATPVAGSVAFDAATDTATYTPDLALDVATTYTATLSTDVTDVAGNPLEAPVAWTFTTDAVAAAIGAVPLGSAGDFVLLAKAGISTTGVTAITGDIGVSPVALTGVTGFDETLDASGTFATSDLVLGRIYAANLTPPTPTLMTAAIGAMETAYTNAAGRTMPDSTELGAGSIGSLPIPPGLHTWSSAVNVNTDLTLTGDATDVWVFQIAQDLTVANNVSVLLAGGAVPENVFWQVAEQVTLGTTAVLHGIVLSQTAIVMTNGAVLTGRAYAQTEITLAAASVTQPLN